MRGESPRQNALDFPGATVQPKKPMESYFAPQAQQCSQQISLQEGEQFLVTYDHVIKAAQEAVLPFRFHIFPAGRGIRIDGDEAAVIIASKIIGQVLHATAGKGALDASWLTETVSAAVAKTLRTELAFHLKGVSSVVLPMSLGQVAFMQTLLSPGEQFVVGHGSTGTGKTHIAIAAALNQLAEERVKHIVITRPHVVMEGELVTAATRHELEHHSQLAFVEDILHNLISHQGLNQLIEQRKLELLPLGRMRGRTFDNAFIILDEAQNMTISKMRMAVTRIGRDSRMVVTGDPTHVDLLGDETSGLTHLLGLLQGTEIATIHQFEASQIIRNNIVARLEELYAQQRDGGQRFAA
jgi:phosphate starvation-inducible PhoH-like protein